jgi:iron-sulfur cluster repair protein YtfE (RIC family)
VIAIGEGIIEVIIEHVHREEQVLFPKLEEELLTSAGGHSSRSEDRERDPVRPSRA